MWKMWKMWITLRIKLLATNKNLDFTGKMRYLWNLAVELCQVGYAQKNPHARHVWNVHKHVDNVDNLLSEKLFSNIYNVSGAHSYQQITMCTTF